MRRRTLAVAAATLAVVTAVGATTTAWAGSHRRGWPGRAGRPSASAKAPSAGASARPSAGVSASATGASASPAGSATATSRPTATVPAGARIFFDDFSYSGAGDPRLAANGWWVRTGGGAPGVSGARWSTDAVTFPADQATPGNTLLRLSASTDGTGAGSVQAEMGTTANAFMTGTYAARVHFTDAPTSGVDGDAVNQTFFTITPLRYDDDPIYSELDFEYLPNGGWGSNVPTMYLTSWYTYHNSPSWGGDRVSGEVRRSLAGWHDLVIQVGSGTVTYFIDGAKVFTSSGKYYPRQAMSIDFNLWFIEGGLLAGSGTRRYDQQVDWVYHVADQIVAPAEMVSQVGALRSAAVGFRDNVTG